MDEYRFLELVDTLCVDSRPGLNRLGAAMLVAAALGLCHDSRAFARRFDVAHALVLRECAILAGDASLIELGARDAMTQRQRYALSECGRQVTAGIEA